MEMNASFSPILDNPLVNEVMQRLRAGGWEIYLVGGCVRDALAGIVAKDYDLATDARPEQIKALLSGIRIIETGIAFGTLIAVSGGHRAEITTFRTDKEYIDGRRPSAVCYTSSLQTDLARRDFTINAMAYSPSTGLIDPFSGQEDMRRRRIRCVGDPIDRLREDSLRILRAIRLVSEWGYTVEKKTFMAMDRLKGELASVSAERVRDELSRILCGDFVEKALTDYVKTMTVLMPELHLSDEVYHHTVRVVQLVPDTPLMRFAALFHDVGKSLIYTDDKDYQTQDDRHSVIGQALAKKICDRLKLPKKTASAITDLVLYHDYRIEATVRGVRHFLRKFPHTLWESLLCLMRADVMALDKTLRDYQIKQLDYLDQLEQLYEKITAEGLCVSLNELAINGHDIRQVGISCGPEIGWLLDDCLTQVIDGHLANRFEDLISYVTIMSKGMDRR